MTIDFDPAADSGSVPSPCVNVCRMNAQTGLCEGCFRTLDEIARWGTANNAFKRSVWGEIKRRQQRLFDAGA